MTSKQRAYLRGLASQIDTIFQIGKGGVTEEILRQLDNALEARELIKVRVLETCEYSAKEAGDGIADALDAEMVTALGSRFVLYKPSKKHQKIDLSAI